MVGSVLLVVDVVSGVGWAAGLAAGLTGFYVGLWYVLPLVRRDRGRPPSTR